MFLLQPVAAIGIVAAAIVVVPIWMTVSLRTARSSSTEMKAISSTVTLMHTSSKHNSTDGTSGSSSTGTSVIGERYRQERL